MTLKELRSKFSKKEINTTRKSNMRRSELMSKVMKKAWYFINMGYENNLSDAMKRAFKVIYATLGENVKETNYMPFDYDLNGSSYNTEYIVVNVNGRY